MRDTLEANIAKHTHVLRLLLKVAEKLSDFISLRQVVAISLTHRYPISSQMDSSKLIDKGIRLSPRPAIGRLMFGDPTGQLTETF